MWGRLAQCLASLILGSGVTGSSLMKDKSVVALSKQHIILYIYIAIMGSPVLMLI